MKDSLGIKWVPRIINLDISDINDISPLYEAETLEDIQLEKFHLKGAKLNINHKINSSKFGDCMFIAPNPVEFYLCGANNSLSAINSNVLKVENGLFKNNSLFFDGISFLIYLCSALEALINQKIPSNIICLIDGKQYSGKENVERSVSIENKIKSVLAIQIGNLPYWTNIKYFIKLRNDVIHLKTATQESDFKSYDDLYKKLLDFNYDECFLNVKKLMKEIYEKK